MLKDFLKKLYGHQHIGQYLRMLYFKESIKHIDFTTGITVLDAGCGRGVYAFYLTKYSSNINIDAFDIADDKIIFCRKLQEKMDCNNLCFKIKDITELNYKDKYDFVYSIDVLEHIKGNKEVIGRFYKALKNRGKLFLHMPGKDGRRILPEGFFKAFDEWADKEHIGEHYSLYELSMMVKEFGFKIIEAKHTFGFWGSLAWEIDRMTDNNRWLKLATVPFLKI